jgi:diaminopimelate decarboxylase
LEFALSVGVGRIIIDHFGEIEMLAELGARCPCALRFAPGVDPKTHVKISTGQADTKFGFNAATGDAERALGLALKFGLEVDGFHCHVGSQLIDTEAQQRGGEELVRFAAQMQRSQGFHMTYLNVGGGLGVRYSDSDHPMEVEAYCQELVGTIQESLRGTNLKTNDLVLAQEPGRSIIAEAGVTLYQIGPIKEVPISATNFRTYVSVDGGLSDNPRPALYNAQYPIEVIPQSDRSTWDYVVDGPGAAFAVPRNKTVHISGKHCETDLLFPDVTVPADLVSGDLIQVLCTGAYNATMASNYNRYPRPASVLLRMNGQAELVQRRETFDEMLAREILPRGL